MKKMFFALMVIVAIALLITAFSEKSKNVKKDEKGFALIELFTSEGCSSCPPADDAMSDIQNKYKNENVVTLGFHVDYWDRLGWKDAFSSPDNTARQEYYSSVFKLSSIYTPEAVVNGKYEFVGSDKSKIVNTVEEQLKSKPSEIINLNAVGNSEGNVEVKFSITGNTSANDQMILLLVEKAATTNVKTGENGGRTLHHINIVRKMSITSTSSKEGTEGFTLPSDLKKENAFITAFTQNKRTGVVTGVATAAIY
ncbi:MAG TPA: DUF1223 domain-containing protein [Chitinophagaceae bacterium]|nr:DUF1223 domain-containing protein [Chitinophagaceae bacterium]